MTEDPVDEGGPAPDDLLRVIVCDDDALMRRLLIITLETDPAIAVVAEATDTDHLLAVCRDHTPDCVVVGLKVAPGGGVEATAGIRRVTPGARIAVVVSSTDETEAVRAVLAGATGLITREAPDQTVAVVRAVCAGVVAVPPLVARLIMDETSRVSAESGPVLTERERAVLEHLAAGHSYRTAAAGLQLPDHTAKNLAANAVEKLVRRVAAAAGPDVVSPA